MAVGKKAGRKTGKKAGKRVRVAEPAPAPEDKPRKSKSEKMIEAAKPKVAELYEKGHTYAEIAQELGIPAGSVPKAVQELEAEWRESGLVAIDRMMTKQLRRLERQYLQCRDGWERSCQDTRTTRIKRELISGHNPRNLLRPPQNGSRTPQPPRPHPDVMRLIREDQETVLKSNAGDVRFLTEMREITAQICKILGIGKDGTQDKAPNVIVNWSEMLVTADGDRPHRGLGTQEILRLVESQISSPAAQQGECSPLSSPSPTSPSPTPLHLLKAKAARQELITPQTDGFDEEDYEAD